MYMRTVAREWSATSISGRMLLASTADSCGAAAVPVLVLLGVIGMG